MARPTDNPWIHRFAVFTAAATLCLIWVGGLVTSHGAGMAVPDWPTSYGYNMFYFPIGQWVGGIFYEHSHRLLAVFIGLLTSILAAWIWGRETAGHVRRTGWAVIGVLVAMLSHRGSERAREGGVENVPAHFQVLAVILPVLLALGVAQIVRTRGSLRWLAMTAFFAVILQGILGGFRVARMQDALGIFHATLAQLFLVLLSVIALLTSRWWRQAAVQLLPLPVGRGEGRGEGTSRKSGPPLPGPLLPRREEREEPATTSVCSAQYEGRKMFKLSVYGAGRLRYLFHIMTGIILIQLVLGAWMRHQHAGLAIPDFPAAYGKLWPAMDDASIVSYNQHRLEVNATNPITAVQIALQMAHRMMALVIFAGVAWVAGAMRSRLGADSPVARLAAVWFGVILLQVILGAATIWTRKAADIATLHVAAGAVGLVTGTLLSIIMFHAAKVTAGQGNRSLPSSSLDARGANASA